MTGKIKDVLIAAVLIAVLIAAYLAGENYSITDGIKPFFKDSGAVESTVSAVDLLKPEKIIIEDGGQMHSVDPDMKMDKSLKADGADGQTIYSSFTAELKNRMDGAESFSEISCEDYEDALSEYSAAAVYVCRISLKDFVSCYDIDYGFDAADSIMPSVIAMAAGEKNAVYIYDSDSGKYYRADAESSGEKNGSTWTGMKDALRDAYSGSGMSYRYADSSGGYIPDEQTSFAIPDETEFKQEYDVSDSGVIDSIVNMFFPNGTDFIRNISCPDGTVSYRYNYTGKILNISPSGRISYSEKTNKNSYRKSDFCSSLNEAASYISSHGGFPDDSGVRVYLKSAVKTGNDGIGGYDFDFEVIYNGLKLAYPDNGQKILAVRTAGSRVIGYYRDLPLASSLVKSSASDDNKGNGGGQDRSMTLAQVTEKNIDELSSALDTKTADTSLQEITDSISSAEICLYREPAAEDELSEGQADTVEAVREEKNSGSDENLSESDSGLSTESTPGGRIVCAWHIIEGGREFWFNAANGNFIASDTVDSK
ncbi:MAG: hypothetical protein PUA82_07435 [Eubacteriales bacterium]|nr:hypothetical protein [Eubacteriales bacterium]